MRTPRILWPLLVLMTAACDNSNTMAGPAPTPTPGPVASLSGSITASGTPLAGAKIQIGDSRNNITVTSNDTGSYAVAGLYPGPALAVVTDGCCPKVYDHFTLLSGSNTLDVTMVVPPTPRPTPCFGDRCRFF